MSKLPKIVLDEWANKVDAVTITTVNTDGMPNSIYATCVSLHDGDKILVADNFFNKTLKNIKDGGKGAVLFLTKENKSYQLKGTFDYATDGELFADMKKWNPEQLPGKGVAVLNVEEIYSGADAIEF